MLHTITISNPHFTPSVKEHKAKISGVPALNAVSAGPTALEPFAIRESEALDTMEGDTDISAMVRLVDTGVLPSDTAASQSSSSLSDTEEGEYDDDQAATEGIGADGDPSQLLNTCTTITDFYDKLHLMRCELYFVDLKGESEGKMTPAHDISGGVSLYYIVCG
jgi:hypothetical protein